MAGLKDPSKFPRVSRLGLVTAATSLTEGQSNFARCLAVSSAGTLYIHFRGACPCNGICKMQNSLCLQVLRSPILAIWQHYCTALEQWASAKLRRLADRATYILQGGHHVGIGPHSRFLLFLLCDAASRPCKPFETAKFL